MFFFVLVLCLLCALVVFLYNECLTCLEVFLDCNAVFVEFLFLCLNRLCLLRFELCCVCSMFFLKYACCLMLCVSCFLFFCASFLCLYV